MLHVVVPQGVRNALPAIGNELIINIKDTAVLSVIGIYELFNQTRRIAGFHYRQLEAYFVVALIYLVLTYGMGWVLRYAESKGGLTPQELTSSN
jgi:putative lysine transport system permease protein